MKKHFCRVLCSLIFFLAGFVFCENLSEDSEKWYQNAKYFYEQRKDYIRAVEACMHALALDPQKHQARELLQKSREKLGLPQHVTSFDKENSLRWYQKGKYIFSALKNETKALLALQKALTYDPENKKALDLIDFIRQQKKYSLDDEKNRMKAKDHLQKANLFLAKGEFTQAETEFENTLESDPNSFDSYIRLFHLYEREANWEKIEKLIEKYLQFLEFGYASEQMVVIFQDEINCLLKRKKLEKSVISNNFSIETLRYYIDGKSSKLLDKIPALLLQYQTNLLEMTVLDQKLLLERNFISELYSCSGKGNFYLYSPTRVRCTLHSSENDRDILNTRKDYDQSSEKDFSKFISRNINDLEKKNRDMVDAREKIVEEYIANGKLKNAIEACLEILKIDEKNFFSLRKISELSFLLRDYDQSLEYSEKIVSQYPSESIGYFRYALAALKKSREKDFFSSIDKLLLLDPDYVEGYLNRGIFYFQKKQLDLGLKDFSEVEKRDENNIRCLFYTALIYFQKKHYEKSRQYFEKLLGILPAGTPLYHRAVELKRKLDRIFPSPKQKSKFQ